MQRTTSCASLTTRLWRIFADPVRRWIARPATNGCAPRYAPSPTPYIDDDVEAMVRLIPTPPGGAAAEGGRSTHPPQCRVYNVGNAQPIEISELADLLEKIMGKPAKRELLPMRPIDVLETFADSSDLERATGFAPRTSIVDGLRSFVEWFCEYHRRPK